ncbi:alpha/beta fold hydrolase [Pacificimonas sp. ICDLI1SI03]
MMTATALQELDFGTISTLDVLGTHVELFTAGSGAPLLFLHGIDGVEGAAPLLRELARSYCVYAPWHPGFGASQRPENLDRVDDLGYFYLDLMAALRLERPTVVGSSFGSWVAAETLTKEPGRASELVLISPLGLRTSHRRESHVTDIFMLSRPELNERIGRHEPELSALPEDRLRREMRGEEALSLYGWSPYMFNPKLSGRLHRIVCPTMIVWGADDRLVRSEYRNRFAKALPRAEVREIPDAGHCVHADQPEQLGTLIGDFAGVKNKA